MASAVETVLRRKARAGSAGSFIALVERKLGLTYPGMAVFVAALWGFGLARILQSRGMTLLVYGMLLILAVSFLLGRRRIGVEATRSDLPSRVKPGQIVDAEVELIAKRTIRTIIMEESLDAELGLPVRVPVPSLPVGQTVVHTYRFSPKLRGIYTIGPLVAEYSDPFGLTRRRTQIAPPVKIVVHPVTEPALDRITVREWEDPPIRPPVLKPWPTGFEFYGLRDYVPGDDPRRIVWRAVAKTGKYLVREAEQGITDRVNIYLDSSVEGHSPGELSETFEKAVSVAASLGEKHLKDGFSVSLDVNSGRLARQFRGQGKRIPLLDKLAEVKREKQGLDVALDRLLFDPYRASHNLIITPFVSPEVAQRIRILMGRGTTMLVVLVMWDDTDPGTLHRASTLGCPVVEVMEGVSLARVFQAVVMARRAGTN